MENANKIKYFKILKFLKDEGYSAKYIRDNIEFFSDISLKNWLEGVPKPTEKELDNIIEEEAKTTFDDITVNKLQEEMKITLFMISELYKKLSPNTSNKDIKKDIKRWLKLGIKTIQE